MLALFIIGITFTSRADALKYIDAETFLKEADLIGLLSSTETVTFIGTAWNRVYIEHSTVITLAHILHLKKVPSSTVYWTDLNSLPKDVVEKIKSGQAPWVPFDHKKWDAVKEQNVITTADLFAPTQSTQFQK